LLLVLGALLGTTLLLPEQAKSQSAKQSPVRRTPVVNAHMPTRKDWYCWATIGARRNIFTLVFTSTSGSTLS
jgi:hypothetical protein